MKKKFRGISLLIVILLVTTFISVKTSKASDIATQPNFTIQDLKATPNPAKVGEDILVTGEIVPQDFETTIPPKEIVLVLDTSGSMKGSKLTKLKEAANNFIDKMSKEKNLKIGIVTYKKEASINKAKINNKEIALIPSNNINDLKKIINGLSASDGTNTGEGLRKAAYLLNTDKENNKDANKTIILMSDGMPTYRTMKKEYDKYIWNIYTDITSEVYENGQWKIDGTGNSDNYFQNTNYAIEIGKIINSKNYNVFSIGYSMSDDGIKKLKMIQGAMSGLDMNDNTDTYEEKGFYQTSEGAIDGVFDKIANKILDSYPINNIGLNLNFINGFEFNLGGNKVNLNNVIYTKDSANSSESKIRYTAKPVPFEFIIKGKEVVENKQVFDKISISFPWRDKIVTTNLNNTLSMTVKSNELPIINASLSSETEVILNKNETTTIKYNINPEDFEFKDINNTNEKDVVIVIDSSSDMEGKFDIIKQNSLWNKVINNDILRNSNTQYALITFSEKSKVESNLTNNITYLNDNILKNIDKSSLNHKNIGETFNDIITVLDNGRKEASKNVIFLSTENVSYTSSQFDTLKNKNYNIITVSMENGNTNSNLIKLHSKLNEENENLFNIGNDQNKIEDPIMGKVAERLISGISYKPYTFNPVMKIDLGDNFEAVSGIEKIEGNIATIKIPRPITYNYSKEDKKYKVNKEEGEIEVAFNIKPKAGKLGILNFGKIHKLFYEKLIGDGEKYSLITETPIIKVKQDIKGLEHGLYEGVKDNSIKLYNSLEGNEIIISPGSTVTFGAKFITSNDDFELTLNGDSKFNKIETSDIKVYKLDKRTNSLVKITNSEDETNKKNLIITDSGDNKFTIKANNLNNNSEDTDLIVIYKGRIKEDIENEYFINSVIISDLNAEVKIKTGSSSNSNNEENEENEEDYQGVLPDLF